MTATKTLAEMTTEVDEFCQDKGWREKVSFPTRMALLHSEVSEALEAYRDWGLEDATGRALDAGETMPKPEGVGSEYADILIRLLDDVAVQGVNLQEAVENHRGKYGIQEDFGDQIQTMHLLIDRLYMAWESAVDWGTDCDWERYHGSFAGVYIYLTQLAEHHGIDLNAEYERKMAYNRTRPYRHGGKKI